MRADSRWLGSASLGGLALSVLSIDTEERVRRSAPADPRPQRHEHLGGRRETVARRSPGPRDADPRRLAVAAERAVPAEHQLGGTRSAGGWIFGGAQTGGAQLRHIALEATALEFFHGRAAITLLARDDARGALLLERARPGTPLSTLVPTHDEQATEILIDVMRRLHRPAPAGTALPELSSRSASFSQYLRAHPGDDPLPRQLVERASRLFAELCTSATAQVVLHGDLHHDNVLADDREQWLAIDPHGAVGDPGYDVGALLYNPDPASRDSTVPGLLFTRIEQLADGLGMPLERVVAWGFVQAVLSEVWTTEGSGTVGRRPFEVARALLPHLP
jgi:streptomycin 6-kinase